MKKINFHIEPSSFSSRIRYVINFLANHPHCPKNVEIHFTEQGEFSENAVSVFYGTKAKTGSWLIPAQTVIFADPIFPSKQLSANVYHYENWNLYDVAATSKPAAPFVKDKTFGFDLLEMLFFHLSRYEEFHCHEKDWDEWEMLQSKLQFLRRNSIHQIPVVDQLVYCFFKVLGFEPKFSQTQMSMSHDIDVFRKYTSLYRFARTSARNWIERKGLKGQVDLINAFIDTKRGNRADPYDTFEFLLLSNPLIEKYIYFLSGGVTVYDRFYQIKEDYVPAVIQLALDRGYKIGLHPSYNAHTNQALLQEEKNRLEQISGLEIIHSRQHFLHFDQRKTLSLLENVGLQSDATFGYQDTIGFRCGTGFPYLLYNLEKERASSIKEIPMVVMDTALLMEDQENLVRFQQHLFQFLEANKYLTHITFNFHNSTFDPLRLDGERFRSIYFQLISIARK